MQGTNAKNILWILCWHLLWQVPSWNSAEELSKSLPLYDTISICAIAIENSNLSRRHDHFSIWSCPYGKCEFWNKRCSTPTTQRDLPSWRKHFTPSAQSAMTICFLCLFQYDWVHSEVWNLFFKIANRSVICRSWIFSLQTSPLLVITRG